MPTVNDIIVRKPTAAEKKICNIWPVWGADVSRFDWEYTQIEKCLLIEGEVAVSDRPESGKVVTFGDGDYVVFPNGLKCVWDIKKPVRKHYDFE